MDLRPTWAEYYLGIADAVAARADCTRRRVGSIVVKDNSIVATGYNGYPSGEPGCLSAGACPRGRHFLEDPIRNLCGCGNKWPCNQAVAPGSSYDTGKGACGAIHSELNALLRAGDRAVGATIYCTETPCDACLRAIKGAGIARAVWYGGSWEKPQPERKTWVRSLFKR